MLPIAKEYYLCLLKCKKQYVRDCYLRTGFKYLADSKKCWPLDVSPLITWPLITKGTGSDKTDSYNLVYIGYK